MVKMTDEEIKANVSEKAVQYGVPTEYSELFDYLDDQFKTDFTREISARQFGLPIVKYSHPNGCWVIIGTKELGWYDKKTIQFVGLGEIVRTEFLDMEEAKKKEKNIMLVKFHLERVGLITSDNRIIELFIKSGNEYFAFQHMMIRIWQLI